MVLLNLKWGTDVVGIPSTSQQLFTIVVLMQDCQNVLATDHIGGR